jgi:hypothetical protein
MSTSPVVDTFVGLPLGKDENALQIDEDEIGGSLYDDELVLEDEDCRNSVKKSKSGPLTFNKSVIPEIEKSNTVLSGLSMVLSEASSMNDVNMQSITIYLPTGDSLEILLVHCKENILPPLQYKCPLNYILRIHDIDGEPDDDFPALDSDKYLSSYGIQMNEYCLCQVAGFIKDELNHSTSNDNSYTRRSISLDRSDAVRVGISVNVDVVGTKEPLIFSRLHESTMLRELLPVIANRCRLRYLIT